MKVKKTFRIEEKTAHDLEEYAKQKNVSQTDILEDAINKAIQEQYVSHTQDPEDGTDWKALYLAEKKHTDAMAEKLIDLSSKVADSLQAAQVLQAMNKPLLEDSEEQKKRHWWNFWRSR